MSLPPVVTPSDFHLSSARPRYSVFSWGPRAMASSVSIFGSRRWAAQCCGPAARHPGPSGTASSGPGAVLPLTKYGQSPRAAANAPSEYCQDECFFFFLCFVASSQCWEREFLAIVCVFRSFSSCPKVLSNPSSCPSEFHVFVLCTNRSSLVPWAVLWKVFLMISILV